MYVGIESLHHEAMLCPSSDLKMILNAIVTVLQIKATIAPMDIAGKLTAVQLGICACYRRLVEHDELQLKGLNKYTISFRLQSSLLILVLDLKITQLILFRFRTAHIY